ncbi:MAG: 4-phosphopantetheinyl transferase [Myxococcales bacterium]|nr:4-phosphopantetheinyl transferase [Myxococcales bacterium]
MGPLDLDREDHLWLVDPAACGAAEQLAAYHQLMSPDERGRQARFVFAPDREAFAVTRALVRTTLSRYAAVAPQDWRFAPDAYGRPLVIGPAGVDAPSFSVAHTRGLIACLISRAARAAVDVEALRPVEDALAIAERHFVDHEVATLRACAAESQRWRFLALWTLKEAYLKALGRGLSLPLSAAAFGVSGRRIEVQLDPACAEPAVRWEFQLLRPVPTHLLALARATADAVAAPARLRSFWTVPLGAPEAAATVDVLATTALV